MDYIDRSVRKNLENGRYFIDAMEWFERKYIYPSTERSILILFCCFLVISSLITLNYTIGIFPLKTDVSVALFTKNIENNIPIIKNIASDNEDTNFSFASYLTANYVKNREAYDYNQIDSKLNFVKINSLKNIYEEFAENFDMTNPGNLIYKYQNNFTSEVKIDSIEKIKNSNKIKIIFTIFLLNNLNNIVKTTQKSATISFVMNNIEKKPDILNFIVDEYKVNEIK